MKLHREHSQRLENALYLGKLLLQMRKTVITKSHRPLPLDPHIYNLKDLSTHQAKQENWDSVCTDLRKFGIKVGKEKKAKLVQGAHSVLHDLIRQMFECD